MAWIKLEQFRNAADLCTVPGLKILSPSAEPNAPCLIFPRSFWKEVRQGGSCPHTSWSQWLMVKPPPVNLIAAVDAGGGTTANPKDIKAIFRRGVAWEAQALQ
jgi:hypothetical protein